MSTDNDCRHHPATAGVIETGPIVIATPAEILTGHPVGSQPDTAVCIGCGRALHETDIVVAYAYRRGEAAAWTVSGLYCHGCAPNHIRSPTRGASEVLVGGRLGTITAPTSRTHRQCLTELKLRAISPPSEGCPP